jgi:DNA polymerase delta subunit 4
VKGLITVTLHLFVKTSEKDDQDLLSTDEKEKILKQFDLATKFGPCIGISRLSRWERAEKKGLSPDPRVKHILLGLSSNESHLKSSVWTNLV